MVNCSSTYSRCNVTLSRIFIQQLLRGKLHVVWQNRMRRWQITSAASDIRTRTGLARRSNHAACYHRFLGHTARYRDAIGHIPQLAHLGHVQAIDLVLGAAAQQTSALENGKECVGGTECEDANR